LFTILVRKRLALKKLSRKEREFQMHRREILEAALDLFSEKGFHNVTMQEIAKESEFAVGTLYKFFANKEELYKALVLEKSKEFHPTLLKALGKGKDEIGCIRAYLEAHIRVFMDNLKFVRLYLAETRGARFNIGAGLDEELEKKHKEILSKLSDVFKRGIRKKLFENFDPYLLARALEGIIHAFLFQHVDDPEGHPFDADLVMKLFFERIVKIDTQK